MKIIIIISIIMKTAIIIISIIAIAAVMVAWYFGKKLKDIFKW